jgi:hypothetical protein
MAVPVVETNNTISHPEGGCPLQVGEGMEMAVPSMPPYPTSSAFFWVVNNVQY